MTRARTYLAAWTLALLPLAALAGPMPAVEPDAADAVQKTQNLLRDPGQRAQAIQGDAKATAAVQSASALLGGNPANEQDFYNQASDIFATLAGEAGNDPQKLKALVEALERDPASLEKRLTPAQRENLSRLAQKMGAPAVPSASP